MRTIHCLVAWLLLATAALAAPQLPAKPTKYFNDYAGSVSAATAQRLNRALEDFEKQTSSQILVAIYPRLPPNAALEDFTLRSAEAWKPGLKERDNGAVLFIFRDDRKMRIEVGYGLEGVIPDLIAKRIIDNEIAPRFRAGDFDGGMTAGVNALMQAARGEYKGTGTTVDSRRGRGRGTPGLPLLFILLMFVFIVFSGIRRQGTMYHRRRRNSWGGWIGGMGSGWGGGGWGGSRGGGSWGGGGGGFSGGGGRFGGGGASGGW
jgi:uncharacterized protein